MKPNTRFIEQRFFTAQDGISVATNFLGSQRPLPRGGTLQGSQDKKGGLAVGDQRESNPVRGHKRSSRLIILAPGFAKCKDAYPMREMAGELTQWGDVIAVDFRGVGKSGGRYHFGGSEYLDLEPILKWARPRYRKVVLLGLSLGSYHCLRAAHSWPQLADKLLLVSCPTRLEDVLRTFGPIRQGFAIASDWKALRKRLSIEFNLFFRWGNPFSRKPNAVDLAADLQVPCAFLVGGRDRLVVKSLSRRVYEKMEGKSSWTEIQGGNHAEFLYLEQTAEFRKWLGKAMHHEN
jgi:pimeloyl-ACP methyl ester carboxylesterase